ncbi:hypothetical protein GCM10007301_54920 [Azorhizobium oxalatiphilum]|uniref:DUF2946 domain-containing protein n=1 Tax=Azorhizobium oxalatiphilum TaxID=980631 RepID=A0A917CGF3_9HYPH|nr:hypothetical protein [Azorhizobium oxalatiphilum]GGF88002.1 hypothetical protein GCM10007301_54920 [Azorhizobium oxalatiphilum]
MLHVTLAYVLLCQLVLSGIAVTQHAVAATTGTLCEGSAQTGGSGDDGRHDALCCTLGCTASAGPALLGPPDPVAFRPPLVEAIGTGRPGISVPVDGGVFLSFTARAPPARG